MKRFLSILLLLFTFSILSAQECDMCGDWTGVKHTVVGGVKTTAKFYLRCKKHNDSHTIQIKSHCKTFDIEEETEHDLGFSYWDIEVEAWDDRSVVFNDCANSGYRYTHKLIWVNGSVELWTIKMEEIFKGKNGETDKGNNLLSEPYKEVTLYKDDDWYKD